MIYFFSNNYRFPTVKWQMLFWSVLSWKKIVMQKVEEFKKYEIQFSMKYVGFFYSLSITSFMLPTKTL